MKSLTTKQLKEIKTELRLIHQSCGEGMDGTWDPTGEGAEGFECMQRGLERIAETLGMKL